MSIALSDLVARLKTNVAVSNGVPTDPQYEQAVRDAVNDFNEAATRLKSTTLAVTSGVDTYALPADFVKFVALKSLTLSRPDLLVTPGGLVPLREPLSETITIEGTVLRITPTPAYTLTRELRYGAGHIASGAPAAYAEMTEREARIVLLLASSYATSCQAAVKVGGVTEYAIGDVRAKVGNAATDLQAQADAWLKQYQAALNTYIGTLTIRG
jgi:hypothetical protein